MNECQAQLGGSLIFGSFGGVFSLFRYPIPPLSALINPIKSVFYLFRLPFISVLSNFSDFLNENYYTFSFHTPL